MGKRDRRYSTRFSQKKSADANITASPAGPLSLQTEGGEARINELRRGGLKEGRYEVTTGTFCEGHSLIISHFEGVRKLDS